MNKKTEIQKIKVNNGRELIAKTKEYKNLGGEWKLWEKYYTGPASDSNVKEYEWGIIISSGKQKVDIKSVNNNWVRGRELNNDDSDGSKFLTNVLDMDEAWKELKQIFPEVAPARQGQVYSLKKIKKNGEDYFLGRYLVAENSWHLKQIIYEWVRENKTKIYQSPNPHFSGWVEIVDGQDGNMYLYVGEKNDSGGREIKIGIDKNEFEKGNYGEYNAEEMLPMNWDLFTIGRPRTPAEQREYYSSTGGLEEEWKRNWPQRGKLCRKYLESLRDRLSERLDYWKKEPNALSGGMCMLTTTMCYIEAVDYELDTMKKNRPAYYAACDGDCSICGVKLCCHYEGQACEKGQKRLVSHEGEHLLPILPPPSPRNNQIRETEKISLLQYFLTHKITKIILNNGKLVIEYNNSQTETKEVNNSELVRYKQLLQNQPNHSISLSELQTNTTPNLFQSNPDNNRLAIGLVLGAGGVILMGIAVYFLSRQKKIKKVK